MSEDASRLDGLPESHKNPKGKSSEESIPIPRDSEKGFPLLQISNNYYNFDDLIVRDKTKESLENVVFENRSAQRLYSYGMRPKNKILFCGPPGTGKTLASKVIASVIGYRLVYVMFDSVLSSYLGETATNLRRIFDFIAKGRFVVIFDEVDIIGKRRDDPHEHGEIKRVINNFIQMLDNFEGQSIIIAATNHQHLLDRAIWRRFDDIIYFDMPDSKRRRKLFEKYLRVLRREKGIALDRMTRETKDYSAADIAQICQDALRKSIVDGKEIVTRDHIMWAMSEQKRRKETILEGQ